MSRVVRTPLSDETAIEFLTVWIIEAASQCPGGIDLHQDCECQRAARIRLLRTQVINEALRNAYDERTPRE